MDNLAWPPADPREWPAWRESLHAWRSEVRERLPDVGASYERTEFAWAASCFTSHKIFLWDQRLLAPGGHGYDLDRYLGAFDARFGQLDTVILWHAYPNLGFDGRNQFDFYRSTPGGLRGLRRLIDELHGRGIRAFLDYNPWDTGTRREGSSDASVLAGLLRETGADGLYLDTLDRAAGEFRAAVDTVRPGIVFESQGFPPLNRLADHHQSWAEDFESRLVPGVLRHRWFEQRHQQHIVHRWARDHGGELHLAWMNGAGLMVWENVFGAWNAWSDRDAALLRAISRLQHQFAAHFTHGTWTPLIETARPEVCASRWDLGRQSLFTLVNISDEPLTGELLRLEVPPGHAALDLVRGRELDGFGTRAAIVTAMESRGVSGVLVLPASEIDAGLRGFLAEQRLRYAGLPPHREEPAPPVTLRPPPPTEPAPGARDGMTALGGGVLLRRYRFRDRECRMYDSAPFTDFPGNWPPDLHRPVEGHESTTLAPFAIDVRPVSNARFKMFLDATGYVPAEGENFVRHWRDRAPVPGAEEEPVVYIDLDDARAFAAWEGKRLPTEAEWQFAAESGLIDFGTPRVWNWTESERSDGRTRFCILKGGCDFEALGSYWYADSGPQEPAFAAKYLLQGPSQDRAGTIGFRCVASTDPCSAPRTPLAPVTLCTLPQGATDGRAYFTFPPQHLSRRPRVGQASPGGGGTPRHDHERVLRDGDSDAAAGR